MAESGKKRGWLALAALGVVVAVVVAIGMRLSDAQEDAETDAFADEFVAATKPVEIHYLVDGTADGAEVTATTPDGVVQESVEILDLAYTERFEFAPGDAVSISAQSTGETGTVTCTITAVYGPGENVTLAENESSGPYSVVSCDAVVGSAP